MHPATVVLLMVAVAVWTYVVAEMGDHARRQASAQSKTMIVGILVGVLTAGVLQAVEELTEAEWLTRLTWPAGLLAWAVYYVRATYRWAKNNPPPKT